MLNKAKSLGPYKITIVKMRSDHIPNLHELSMAVRWPHRPDDWAALIGMGQGIVARDTLGRIICAGMWFPVGEAFASIGMVMSSPRLQGRGLGRWMMSHLIETTGSRNLLLNASPEALRLCVHFDFNILRPIFHHGGIVTTIPSAPDIATEMKSQDQEAIIQLDEKAVGASRRDMLNALFKQSEGRIIRRDEKLKGFALCRKFGRGRIVGPIVAATEEDAKALIKPFLTVYSNTYLSVDTGQTDGPFRTYLMNAGLDHRETMTSMAKGKSPLPYGEARILALASPALG